MTDRTRVETLCAHLDSIWANFDELVDSFSEDDWRRKHGADWTLADVPYHMAYFDHEIVAYPLAKGPDLPPEESLELSTVADMHRWNARQFARRSSYFAPDRAMARWRATQDEMRQQLLAMSDADLSCATWMPLTMARGWRTAGDVCVVCLIHAWNEFMQLRFHAGRETPEPKPEVTHIALGEFVRFFQALLDREKAAQMRFTMVWEFTGPGGGNWTVRVADGNAALSEGRADEADLIMTMSPLTFVLFWNQKLDLAKAVASGEIVASNEDGLATFGALYPPADPDKTVPVVF